MSQPLFPLETLLRWLGQRGIDLSPGQWLRVQEALRVLDWEGKKPEALAGLLGPLLVQSEEQQAVFDEVFAQWLKLHVYPEGKKEVVVSEEIEKDRRRWRRPLFAALGVLALLTGLGIAYLLRPPAEPLPLPDPAFSLADPCLAPGDTLRARYAVGETPDSSLRFAWRLDGQPVGDNAPQLSLPTLAPGPHQLALTVGRGEVDSTRRQRFFVRAGPRPVARIDTLRQGDRYTFVADSQAPGWRYRWDFGGGDTAAGPQATRAMAPGQQHSIRLTVSLEGDFEGHCSAQRTLLLDLRELLVELPPLAPLRLGEEELTYQWRLYPWLAWPLLCLLAYLAWAFWGRYRRRLPEDSTLQRALTPASGPPIELDFPNQEQHLGDGPALSELARRLRQREHSQRCDLDLPDTLQATVRAGGFPALRYRQQERPVEYLALVESQGPHDQQARLIGALLQRLRSEEVPIQPWYYQGSPRLCYQPGQEDLVPLSRLAQRFVGHRLMIFGRAETLLDARQADLRHSLAALLPLWQERALLTPLPVADWGRAEARLREHLILLPADLAGQHALVEAWDERDPPDFRTLQRQLLIERPEEEALMDYDLRQVADLKAFLGPRRFRWVAAAALYPRPVWAITLAVAARLEAASPPAEGANSFSPPLEGGGERNLLTYDDLLPLTRLPWLQDGDLGEELRAQLLAELDPATERLARQALLDLLAQTDPPAESHAARERDVQRAIQQAQLAPADPRQQQALRVMLAQGLLDQIGRAHV